ncbi:NUDIX domain-containing protein [Pseudomonas sp. WS 5019]|nr:NUDIX domain-containing protein [Pseudomonas sp. WS 5019]NMY18444.1 NUDIX domain-containing protein [Pseudomonas sp. WS 5019]
MPTTLHIAAACLFDARGRLLLVRKRNTRCFMLAGGKREADEDALSALERELLEELEELRWLDTAQPLPDDLAPLLCEQVLPALQRLPSL